MRCRPGGHLDGLQIEAGRCCAGRQGATAEIRQLDDLKENGGSLPFERCDRVGHWASRLPVTLLKKKRHKKGPQLVTHSYVAHPSRRQVTTRALSF